MQMGVYRAYLATNYKPENYVDRGGGGVSWPFSHPLKEYPRFLIYKNGGDYLFSSNLDIWQQNIPEFSVSE